MNNLSGGRLISFQKSLLEWFYTNRRTFPWREETSPYKILVAEKLLQQTTASERVVAAFTLLIDRYPTPEDLANAELRHLNKVIKPLGFKYRARELRELARQIVKVHSNSIPRDLDELLSLPGVGSYIARAVLCFGFSIPVAIVDTNVARFIFRVFCLSDKFPANPARKKNLIAKAQSLLPNTEFKEFNLAILDLCAKICLPRKPKCEACPVLKFCCYGLASSEYPK